MKPLRYLAVMVALLPALIAGACGQPKTNMDKEIVMDERQSNTKPLRGTAVFGAGCFWCVEAVFLQLAGVDSIEPGYAGGTVDDPTYEQVCSGTTGHAEVCRIIFDPEIITYPELLEAFFSSHDPTTLNRQGEDVGSQYRSVIFYSDEEQRKLAEDYKAELERAGVFDDPIVTEVVPLVKFYSAEDYHRNYYARNPDQAYCRLVIRPKLEKFTRKFKDKLKNPSR